MELGGNTTLKNFDGYGTSQAFGDHVLNITGKIGGCWYSMRGEKLA